MIKCSECKYCEEYGSGKGYYCNYEEPLEIYNIYAEVDCKNFESKTKSNINHPQHYNHGNIETIDKIKTMLTSEEFKGFLKGNIIKYIDRADYKGHKEEDLGKADWYLRKLKEEEK